MALSYHITPNMTDKRMEKNMRKAMLIILLLLMSTLTLSAQDDTAYVRFAHFVPDVDDVSIELNGTVITTANFADVSAWLEVPAGDLSASATVVDNSDIVVPVNATLSADEWVTVAFIGVLEADSVSAQVIREDYSPALTGEKRVSIFHAIYGAPPVNVVVDDITLVQTLAYPDSLVPEGDGYVTFDLVAGTYDFEVQIDGETITNTGDIVTGSGRHYFLGIIGTPTNPQYVFVSSDLTSDDMVEPTVSVDEIDTGEGEASVRAMHLVSGADAVDVYVNGDVVAEGLAFTAATPYLDVPAGVYTFGITPTGESEFLYEERLAIVAGERYSIGAVPNLATGGIMFQQVAEEQVELVAGETRIAVMHAVPDLSPVNLVANDFVLLQGLGFPGTFEGSDGYATTDIVAGEYDIVITDEDGNELFDLGSLTLGAGRVYYITVAGYADSAIYTLETLTTE
jgi:hypothetical protein